MHPVSLPHGRAATGVPGLDEILGGGLPRRRIHLVHGAPGTGKTTLGFQFLREGARAGERVLYVTLLQTGSELQEFADSHGWDLARIDLLEMPDQVRESAAAEQTLFAAAQVELREIVDAVIEAVERRRPERLVLDSLSEMLVLVDATHQLRQQLLRLKDRLDGLGCTSVFNAGDADREDLAALLTMVHGAIGLEMNAPVYGAPSRRLVISKMRALAYRGGYHDFTIRTGGLEVYPRLAMAGRTRRTDWRILSSGVAELDALVGGGLERGTACLLAGTTGAGKSTLATLYLVAAARQRQRSLVLCFDERRETFLHRAAGLGIDLAPHVEAGTVDLRQIDVGELTPGRLSHLIRHAVEEEGVEVVLLDSLTGYAASMPEHGMLHAHLHEILGYLSAAGVLSFMIVAMHGLSGPVETGFDASYLADTVILVRHFEAAGAIRRCLSVFKKRHGGHENTIREFFIDGDGVRVGEPLRGFSAVLSGMPSFKGPASRLLDEEPDGGGGRS